MLAVLYCVVTVALLTSSSPTTETAVLTESRLWLRLLESMLGAAGQIPTAVAVARLVNPYHY